MLRSANIAKTEQIVRRRICHKGGGTKMKRLLIIGLAGCAFSLAPTMSASAMPAATPYTLGGTDEAVIQVKAAMGMGGAITAVAATTTVGTAATTMAGGIITIGGDFPQTKKGLQ
jgi:hypothetical protein